MVGFTMRFPDRFVRRVINQAVPLVLVLCGIGVAVYWTHPPDRPYYRIQDQLLSLDGRHIPEVVALLDSVPDPVERGLAAELWISRNRGHTDVARASVICTTLDPAQVKLCERHLSSAHLSR